MAKFKKAGSDEWVDVGESTGEFQTRMQVNRIGKRGYTEKEKKVLKDKGYSDKQIQEYEDAAKKISELSVEEQQVALGTKSEPKKEVKESYIAYDTEKKQTREANVFEVALAKKQAEQRAYESSIMSREVSKPSPYSNVEQYLSSPEAKDKVIIVKRTDSPEGVVDEVQAEYGVVSDENRLSKEEGKNGVGVSREVVGGTNSLTGGVSGGEVSVKKNIFQRARESIDNFFVRRSEALRKSSEELGSLKGESLFSPIRLEAARLSVSSAATGIIAGSSGIIIHPLESAKGFYNLVRHPVKSAKILFSEFKQNPEYTTGNIIGQSIVIGGIVKSIPIKGAVRTTEIPQAVGEPVKITQVGLETSKGKALVVGAKTPEGLNFGSPNIKPFLGTAKEGELLRIGSALETKTVQKALKELPSEKFVSPERATEFIPTAQSILSKTEGVKSMFQEGFVLETKRLPSAGVEIVLEVAKENKGVVSGSFSRSADLAKEFTIKGEEFVLNKKPRDIDIHLDKYSPEKIQFVTQETLVKLQEAGFDARMVGEGGIVKNAIEVKQPSGEYAKAVEFLGEGTIPKAEIPPDYVLGIKKAGTPEKLQGVLKTSLSEELRGVTQGTARLRKTSEGKFDIFPPEKRIKDIGSVSVSARTLAESKLFNKGLYKDIEKFESFYPEELVREQVLKVGGIEKIGLFDFSEVKNPSSVFPPKPNIPPLVPISMVSKEPFVEEPSVSVVSSPSKLPSPSGISLKPSPSVSKPSSIPSNISPNKIPSQSISPSKSSSNKSTSPSPSNIPSPPSPSPSPSNIPSPSIISPSSTSSSSSQSSKSTSSSSTLISPPSKLYAPKRLIYYQPRETKKIGSFGVSVRRSGLFKELPQTFATEEQAKRFGMGIVGQSAAASFKTFKSNKAPTTGSIGFKVNPENFEPSKTEEGVIIEKRGKRLKKGGRKEYLQVRTGNKFSL